MRSHLFAGLQTFRSNSEDQRCFYFHLQAYQKKELEIFQLLFSMFSYFGLHGVRFLHSAKKYESFCPSLRRNRLRRLNDTTSTKGA